MYDLVIIGGSTAGTAAAIYAARRGLNFKVVTKDFNGELATSGEIGNWPGIPETNGIELAQKFREHLEFLGVSIDEDIEIKKIEKKNGSFLVDGYETKTVIIATGAHPRELNIPGEKEFRNKGVSYCTTCDGPIFAGKVVATIGGGNSALESALMLADLCKKVYVINKNPQFKGDAVLIDNLQNKPNVEIIYSALTKEIIGNEFVTGLRYNDREITVDGIFVHIGMIANSAMAPEGVEKNNFGEIVINQSCETNIPGLYAAGDVTNMQYKQNPIAAGQGVTALLSAVSYLNRL
ncbi:MAG: FAD-dependent oxidoreductase [Patescibacteria group bacterium]